MKPKAPATDVFTRLCAAELHIECLKEYRFFKVSKFQRLWLCNGQMWYIDAKKPTKKK